MWLWTIAQGEENDVAFATLGESSRPPVNEEFEATEQVEPDRRGRLAIPAVDGSSNTSMCLRQRHDSPPTTSSDQDVAHTVVGVAARTSRTRVGPRRESRTLDQCG